MKTPIKIEEKFKSSDGEIFDITDFPHCKTFEDILDFGFDKKDSGSEIFEVCASAEHLRDILSYEIAVAEFERMSESDRLDECIKFFELNKFEEDKFVKEGIKIYNITTSGEFNLVTRHPAENNYQFLNPRDFIEHEYLIPDHLHKVTHDLYKKGIDYIKKLLEVAIYLNISSFVDLLKRLIANKILMLTVIMHIFDFLDCTLNDEELFARRSEYITQTYEILEMDLPSVEDLLELQHKIRYDILCYYEEIEDVKKKVSVEKKQKKDFDILIRDANYEELTSLEELESTEWFSSMIKETLME